jgi:hypothetical protein
VLILYVDCVQVLTVCHEIGRGLAARGQPSLGAFVLASVAGGGGAAALVDALVGAFPTTFDDSYEVLDGAGAQARVALYKKAQLVASELCGRYRDGPVPALRFHDFGRLTAFVDNVVVAMARQAGAVVCTPAVADAIARGEPLARGSAPEVALRAAALLAVEVAVETINAGGAAGATGVPPLVPAELCNWMWGWLGKTPEGRAYERHAAPGTLFY